jgi:hypothetical protein
MNKTPAARTLKNGGDVATRLPAQDLQRGRCHHAERLGLEPIDERPHGPRYNDPGPRTEKLGLEPLDERPGGPRHNASVPKTDPGGNTLAIEEGRTP